MVPGSSSQHLWPAGERVRKLLIRPGRADRANAAVSRRRPRRREHQTDSWRHWSCRCDGVRRSNHTSGYCSSAGGPASRSADSVLQGPAEDQDEDRDGPGPAENLEKSLRRHPADLNNAQPLLRGWEAQPRVTSLWVTTSPAILPRRLRLTQLQRHSRRRRGGQALVDALIALRKHCQLSQVELLSVWGAPAHRERFREGAQRPQTVYAATLCPCIGRPAAAGQRKFPRCAVPTMASGSLPSGSAREPWVWWVQTRNLMQTNWARHISGSAG